MYKQSIIHFYLSALLVFAGKSSGSMRIRIRITVFIVKTFETNVAYPDRNFPDPNPNS